MIRFLLKYINFHIKIKGIKIPLIGGIGYDNIGGSEKWMSELIQQRISKWEGTFIDVGVNIGQTLIKLKRINKDFDYIGFEPNPTCIHYCQNLIRLNKLPNIILIPAGLSDKTKITKLLFLNKDIADSCASIIPENRSKNVTTENIITIGSEILPTTNRISVIKIDVEEAELLVIKCLKVIIERDKPEIMIEILPTYNTNKIRTDRQNEIIKYFKEINYSLFRIDKNNDDSLKGLTKINEIEGHSNLKKCDYLFLPVE